MDMHDKDNKSSVFMFFSPKCSKLFTYILSIKVYNAPLRVARVMSIS